MRIANGDTGRYVYFVAVDPSDLKTRETALSNVTVYYSIDGGVANAMTTPTVSAVDVNNMPGVFRLAVDETGMVNLDSAAPGKDTCELCLHIEADEMHPVTRVIEIYRPETTEGQTLTVTGGAVDTVDKLGATAKGHVNAEVADVMRVDANNEISSAPATPTIVEALMFLYMALRNETNTSADQLKIKNDAGTVVFTASLSDVTDIFTKGKF